MTTITDSATLARKSKGETMWIIDKDLIGEGTVNMGDAQRMCSSNYKNGTPLPHRFSLFDDDGECYYQGRTDDDSSFAPLDDFGQQYAGCTEIRINGRRI